MSMNYMQYQQPLQRQNYYQQAMSYGNNRIKPVSSIDEVRASSIDFDGSVFYFPDLANKKIYTKQIGLDGIAILNMYELKEVLPSAFQQAQVDTSQFITREEFEKAIKELAASHIDNSTLTQKTQAQNGKESFEF